MSIAVICTGTELLKGSAVNTNLAFLGRELAAAGLPASLEITVGDHADELIRAIAEGLHVADTLIISGGLGPTTDDLTLDTVAHQQGYISISPMTTDRTNHSLFREVEADIVDDVNFIRTSFIKELM